MKRTVREELEYWNIIYIIKRLNKYFNRLHGYERGINGLTAEDFSMMVLQKIVSGERSWEKHKGDDFMGFCFDVMKSDVNHARNSTEYRTMVRMKQSEISEHLESERHRIRWERNGLKDEFNGF